ncbi:MAG: putative DNA-binding domain-containing protein [Sphingobium limneticum]
MRTPDAPASMRAEIDALCVAARRQPDSLYGRLLRENVADVLACTFPLFSARHGAPQVIEAVDQFVAGHAAAHPQFHQIADEFVLFAQTRLGLTAPLLALLEFEWALLAVEIDPARVPAPNTGTPDLNPTLRTLLLPFDPADKDCRTGGPFPYAAFRTSDHRIVTLPLGRLDCLLIEQFRSLTALSPRRDAEDRAVATWVAQALTTGLLIPIDTNHGDLR